MELEYKEHLLVDAKHTEARNVKHLICTISFNGIVFTWWGLEVGQTDLTPKQKQWLDSHADEITVALSERRALPPSLHFDQMTRSQRTTMRRPNRLVGQFCKATDIKDS
jgi:hypothetical protein